jgi:hypothetical protein
MRKGFPAASAEGEALSACHPVCAAASTAGGFDGCRRLHRGNAGFGDSCRSRQIFPRVVRLNV